MTAGIVSLHCASTLPAPTFLLRLFRDPFPSLCCASLPPGAVFAVPCCSAEPRHLCKCGFTVCSLPKRHFLEKKRGARTTCTHPGGVRGVLAETSVASRYIEVTRRELLSGSIALKKPTSHAFSVSFCVLLMPFSAGNF